MIPKCLVLCSNCLDDQPINTLAHRRSNKASVPFEQAEFVSWPGFWECGCHSAVRAINFTGGAELENAREFHIEKCVHTIWRGEGRRGEEGRRREEEPAGRMCLFWWSRSCWCGWLCLLECVAEHRRNKASGT